MAITPKAGYTVDPNNSNGVVPLNDPSLKNPNSPALGANFGQPSVPTPAPTPASTNNGTPIATDPTAGMTDQEKQAYNYKNTFVAPKTEDQIAQEKQTQAQAQIDSLNRYYDSLLQDQATVNAGRDRSTNALSVMSGLSGSTEATESFNTTNSLNARDNAKIQNERAVAVTGVLSKIRSDAVTEAKSQRDEARLSSESILQNRADRVTKATNHLVALSKMGSATLEGLKSTLKPEEYNYLVQNVGGEAMAKAILFENRSKDSLMGSPTVVGDHIVQYYQSPDGKIRSENVPLPEGVAMKKDNIQSIQKTDQGLFIINKDGTWNKITGSQDNPAKLSITDQKLTAITNYSNAFSPGIKMADGTPTLSPTGNATYTAWKEAIKEAPTKGIPRADFIKQYGYLLETKDGQVSPEYGLTEVEQKQVVGSKNANDELIQLINSIK